MRRAQFYGVDVEVVGPGLPSESMGVPPGYLYAARILVQHHTRSGGGVRPEPRVVPSARRMRPLPLADAFQKPVKRPPSSHRA